MRPTRHALALYAFALVGLLLPAAGCKEKLEDCPGHCTVVTGRLLTSGLQPLAGASVTASWQPLHSYGSRDKARATTDANGNYQLSFYAKDDELLDGYFNVAYAASSAAYYAAKGTEDALPLDIKRDTVYQLPPFLIPRKAFIKLTVPNADQIQQGFSVNFTSAYGHHLATRKGVGAGEVVSVARQPAPFSRTIEMAADQTVYMQTYRSTSGGATFTLDSLVIPAGTTRSVTVRY